MAIRVPLQRWRGASGHSQGPAVRRGCCPASRAAAWLAAGAGCAGCWHKPPPADGVLPCGCVQKRRNPGTTPRVRRVVFRPVLPNKALRPWAGIEPATTPFGGLYQTELPVLASRESNPARPLARRHHDLAVTQRLRCAACRKSTGLLEPGFPAPAGRTLVLTPACERSPLALDALSIARCVPARGLRLEIFQVVDLYRKIL